MSKLLDYINTLDKDAVAREAHKKDPVAAMKTFGLSEEEQTALLSGDKKKVAALVGVDEDSLPTIQTLITTF
ncbi:hypothetical protein BH11PSE12_BH11PSE12_14130 [soil metagenome]